MLPVSVSDGFRYILVDMQAVMPHRNNVPLHHLDNFSGREYSEIQAEIPDSGMRGNQEVGAYSVIG
jgi:hypothetical protein